MNEKYVLALARDVYPLLVPLTRTKRGKMSYSEVCDRLEVILSLIVPRSWNAADALTAVHILQETIEAIWFVHGEEMHRCQELYGSSPSSFPQNWLVQRQEHWMKADDEDRPKDPDLPF